VALLLDRNAGFEGDDNRNGCTPLMSAASNNHTAVVDLLLETGASVNVQDQLGHGALFLAAQHGHADMVKLLLDHGADVNMLSGDRTSALMQAAAEGHQAVVKVLLGQPGLDIVAENDKGETAEDLARTHIVCALLRVSAGNGDCRLRGRAILRPAPTALVGNLLMITDDTTICLEGNRMHPSRGRLTPGMA
jgi:hypothetical protein